jgi:hypothetical protein
MVKSRVAQYCRRGLMPSFVGSRVVAATIVALGVSVPTSRGVAQSACRAADTRSADLIEQITAYVTATSGDDAVSRDSLHLPTAAATDVQLVTSDSVCALAAAAYNVDRQGSGTGLSGRVYVIKIQSTCVVHDPEYVYDPAHPGGLVMIVFDAS